MLDGQKPSTPKLIGGIAQLVDGSRHDVAIGFSDE
jgi:hypothetical protein